ncbi:MAG TPA: RagB/SusD family nutrient uptake outer membrane protein [Kofleriaceae bacterium]
MHTKQLALVVAGILSSLALSACSLDIPDLNNPGLDQVQDTPTAASINTAATGLIIGDRGGKSATTGTVNQLGILGREAYDFESADVRFVSELLQANLSKASPFGGAFWAAQYTIIRLANIILKGADKVPEFNDDNKSALKGFAHTMIAMEFITIIITHDSTGAPIDVDHPLGDPLGPFVPTDAVYTEIARLLDLGFDELTAAKKSAFTFALSPGYTGFTNADTYATFNRALKAKIACYQKNYQAALDAVGKSFISDSRTAMTINFDLGPSHVYSLGSGDQQNGLVNPNIYAHPSLETDAQKQTDGTTLDARFVAKVDKLLNADKTVKTITSMTDPSLKTTIKFKRYPTNISPVPIIRNEELMLYKAEALWFTGDKAGAIDELNFVRTKSGKLPVLSPDPATDDEFVNALLYERRYSLMFEGGHRWIDLRRFGKELPVDAPTHTRNVRFPVPQAECDARPGEPACMITSSSP